MDGRNTSQDPEYVGPVGHEKKFHKTHFQMPELKLRDTGEGEWTWERIAPGRYKRVRKRIASATAER